jgi:hypothetical protein
LATLIAGGLFFTRKKRKINAEGTGDLNAFGGLIFCGTKIMFLIKSFHIAGYENLIPMSAMRHSQIEPVEYEAPIESDFSKVVRVSDFERYLGDAIYLGLLKDQHLVKIF